MPLIALDQIHEPPAPVRRRAASPEQDAALQASIAAQGVLTPVLLRPNGNGFVLVAGARRLRAVRALGHDAVPAHVLDLAQQSETAAAAAENMVRANMDPLDQWRVIADLQREGYTLSHAAACLGLTDRAARRLDKLSRLHPDMLALIERLGLPEEHHFSAIVCAAMETQATAAAEGARKNDDNPDYVWSVVARACQTRRIGRALALFDPAQESVVFDEDLFAEPDDEEAIYTTDVPGFIAAQQRAVARDVAARRNKKERVQLASVDKYNAIELPKGWTRTFSDPAKPKKTETVFVAVGETGYDTGRVLRVCAVKAKDTGAGKDKAAAPDADEDSDDAEPAPARRRASADADAPDTESRDPITAVGRDLIAVAKTKALVTHLTDTSVDRGSHWTLAYLVLALGARTVRVSNRNGYGQHDFADLAARLVPPEGAGAMHLDDLGAVATEALTRLLFVPGAKESPDPAVEWIGHVSGADAALPRFDTPEFLAHVSGAELKRLAVAHGLKPAKTVAGLRAQLAGALPDWRPAMFGAPGPIPERED